MNSVIDSHAPFKMVDKFKLRLKTKSWLTSDPQRSISVENALHNKFINSKKKKNNPAKEHYHIKYKICRNML